MKITAILLQLLTLTAALSFSGCATNGVTQFYEPNTKLVAPPLEEYSGKTQIYSSSNIQEEITLMYRRGYFPLGQSAFSSGSTVTQNQILEQAKKIGADVVLFKSDYAGSTQVNVPIMQYNPGQTSTTYASGNVNANVQNNRGYYASGTANYSGMATTTTSGTYSTSIMPMTVHRTNFDIIFWRKAKPRKLGAQLLPLPQELREKLKRNTGVWVADIFDNEPAFYGNMLKGDIIVAINGQPTPGSPEASDLIARYAGTKAKFTVQRGDETLDLEIQLNP